MKKKKFSVKIEKYTVLYLVSLFTIIFYFLNTGLDSWAETNIEFYPYAIGGKVHTEGLAGYFSFFPIVLSKIYYHLLWETSVSWFVFSAISSFAFCSVALFMICKCFKQMQVGFWISCLTMMSILSVLAHPSSRSLTNIAHIGYLPIIMYIMWIVFNQSNDRIYQRIPVTVLVMLLIAALSKPSFFFIVFIFFLCMFHIPKNKTTIICIVISIILNVYQVMHMSVEGVHIFFTKFTDVFNLLFSSISAIGSALTFNFTFYNSYGVSNTYLVISELLTFSLILLMIMMLIHFKDRKSMFAVICMNLAIVACCSAYVIAAYSSQNSYFTNIQNTVYGASSKYKLQYQLISGPILLTIFLYLLQFVVREFKINIYVRKLGIIILCLGMTNGILSAIASANTIVVQPYGLDTALLRNIDSKYIAPPFQDWDREWQKEFKASWSRGQQYSKYLENTELAVRAGFEKRNPERIPDNIKQGRIYIVVKEPEISRINETDYIYQLFHVNKSENLLVNGTTVLFSKYTSIGYRYAILQITPQIIEDLKTGEFKIYNPQKSEYIQDKYINYTIVY